MKTVRPIRTIGTIGDIHTGSVVGLNPPDELPSRLIGSRYLWDCWMKTVDEWPSLDILLLTGDLVDGEQRKSTGKGVLTTDVGEQAEWAVKVLEPMAAKAKTIIRVDGTPYHEGDSVAAMAIIDAKLGVSHHAQVIDLEMPNGLILNVAHHPAGSGAIYKGTSVDRESLWSVIAAAQGFVPDARWIVRGHTHHYIQQYTRGKTMIFCPCWQLQTKYAVKSNYYRWQPSLGGILMVEDKDVDGGYKFAPRLFDVPPVEVTMATALQTRKQILAARAVDRDTELLERFAREKKSKKAA